MFELFKYFIYVVRGTLDNFDPVTDMLVDSGTYLTWRRHNDESPDRGVPYAGALKDFQLNSWVVLRFNRWMYYEGVEEWLDYLAQGKKTLGAYKASEYRGLFRENPPSWEIPLAVWHENKLPVAENFYRDIWDVWPGWLVEKLESLSEPTARWEYLREKMIEVLQDERGVH